MAFIGTRVFATRAGDTYSPLMPVSLYMSAPVDEMVVILDVLRQTR